jgi:hypothetical protein
MKYHIILPGNYKKTEIESAQSISFISDYVGYDFNPFKNPSLMYNLMDHIHMSGRLWGKDEAARDYLDGIKMLLEEIQHFLSECFKECNEIINNVPIEIRSDVLIRYLYCLDSWWETEMGKLCWEYSSLHEDAKTELQKILASMKEEEERLLGKTKCNIQT